MVVKSIPTYECKLYIGSREGYHGESFKYSDVATKVEKFNDGRKANKIYICGIRITTCYIAISSDYSEPGYELAVINYPRFPFSDLQINQYMFDLGEYLLVELKQNRMSLVTPSTTYLLKNKDAEESP